jgi:predicted O-linked N-acetylglucosamine transferase (SPINDLY family)
LDTTGLDAIDYMIVDPLFLPPAESRYCMSETPLVLPRSYLCYRPPEYAPDVLPLPALGKGTLRFGCFNNLAKLNEAVISLWARLLKTVPDATLALKTYSLSHQRSRDWVVKRFAAHGVAAGRLALDGGVPHDELLAAYGEIDIALDPFPYTGGLTTLEALWMGVPVVTLAGDTLLGRMGVTCLANAGLAEFVAATADDYVEIARRCARDLPRLAQLRAQMRGRLSQTTLFDGAAFTRDLESGYRQAWRRWCEEVAQHDAGSPLVRGIK